VTGVVDYRSGAEERPVWLGEQDLVELAIGEEGRILVRPSGTEPKLKIYVDLTEEVSGDPDAQQQRLLDRAGQIGSDLERSLRI
jgi:phosphomannomutase